MSRSKEFIRQRNKHTKMTSLEKEYIIESSPENIFKALTDPLEIEQWSGAPAIMQAYKGGEFSLWGGSIIGVNEIMEKNLIQQLWKESKWQEYSNVTFEIKANSQNVSLTLKHTNIPDQSFKDIETGWDDYYLKPLKSYLEL